MICAGRRNTGVPLYPRRRHSGRVSLKYPRLSNVEGGDRLALEENGLHRRKDTLFMSLLPKTNLASLSLAILAGLGLAAAHPANAQVLYSQPYDGTGRSTPSQVYPNVTEYNSYCFDDFTVLGTGWDISQVTAFGRQPRDPNLLSSLVSLAFTTTPDASAITTTYTGVEDANHNLVFTQPIHLDAGNYFITAFVTRSTTVGSWGFNETTPVHGQSFYFSNPGGRFGGGTIPHQPNPGNDLAFEIDGTQSDGVPPAVPEPSSVLTFAVAALGIGGLMIAAKRKKAAPSLSLSLSSSLSSSL